MVGSTVAKYIIQHFPTKFTMAQATDQGYLRLTVPHLSEIANNMSVKPFAVIAGVGSGTGAWLARRFARAYPVALLARNPESYDSLVKEINDNGGRAVGISADVSNDESVKCAFETIAQAYDHAPCAAAVYNASGGFVRRPFLDTRLEDLDKGLNVTVYADI